MRILIDGYNLMHAGGLLGRRFGPDGFRKVRHRFLSDLAARLDPIDAHQTTVVFDATTPPEHAPREARHKGLTVLFAVDEDDADERIERLIAHHSAPKQLTVVSSDHRVRQAASRRKAQVVLAEDFWSSLFDRKVRETLDEPVPTDEERAREHGLSPRESAFWQDTFRDLLDAPEIRGALQGEPVAGLTDADIRAIEREVEEEFRS